MKTHIVAMSLGMLAPVCAHGEPMASETEDVQNRCIVQLVDAVESSKIYPIAHAFAARNNTSLKFIYRNAIKGFTINLPCHTAEAAFGDSDLILSMEPDRVVSINKKPTDAGGGKGKNKTSSQTVSYGTVRVGGPQDGTGYTAWVIDTGVDLNHKDLTVDAGRSFSVFSRDGADDKHGHGTHVAGIIGAKDNSIGSLGVAPNTSIVPIRVLDRRGYGSVSGVIAGVDYVATNARAGDCVNMSLSGGISASLDTAVLNASNMTKAFFTLAAGNGFRHRRVRQLGLFFQFRQPAGRLRRPGCQDLFALERRRDPYCLRHVHGRAACLRGPYADQRQCQQRFNRERRPRQPRRPDHPSTVGFDATGAFHAKKPLDYHR
ncbi:MAG: S8 family serine peptidase [Campylobacterales bacterium]